MNLTAYESPPKMEEVAFADEGAHCPPTMRIEVVTDSGYSVTTLPRLLYSSRPRTSVRFKSSKKVPDASVPPMERQPSPIRRNWAPKLTTPSYVGLLPPPACAAIGNIPTRNTRKNARGQRNRFTARGTSLIQHELQSALTAADLCGLYMCSLTTT